MKFFKINNKLYNEKSIMKIDCSKISNLIIDLYLISNEIIRVEGIEAIEIAMQAKPSIVEGNRFKFRKNAWIIHNLFAHPLMQIFAFFRAYKLAIWIHEITIPKPIGQK